MSRSRQLPQGNQEVQRVHWQSAEPSDEPGAALERGDEIVQQLSIAKYALVVGDTEQAMGAIDAALSTSRGSLSELADASAAPHHSTYAGALIRTTPAASSPDGDPAPN
jgi:hypothetical protein